jgi:hypothetical protein
VVSPGTPVFTTNKTDRHDITEILLKEALNIINLTPLNYLVLQSLAFQHYLMKVIPEMHRAHKIRYLRFIMITIKYYITLPKGALMVEV